MAIRLQFDRIPPGVEIGPHRHGVETVVYVAGGEIVFEHGDQLERRTVVRAGDVLYEAPSELHTVRNEGTIDALALLAAMEPDPRRPGDIFRRWEADAEPVKRGDAAPVEVEGEIRRKLLVEPGDFGTASFTVFEVTIEAGVRDAWHRHPASEHVLVVFEGRGEVSVGDLVETLEPLKGVRIAAGLAHRVEATGRQRLRYCVVAAPARDRRADRELVEAPRRRMDA
jgi:quercetin dioxygenase-like cupin family protein